VTLQRGREARGERGQVLVLLAIFLTGILIALALVFDGAQSLVLRRQLQNTADAAALAGVNIVQALGGCTSTLVSKTGPGNTIYTTVRQSVMDNMGVSSSRADTLLTKADGTNAVECATDAAYSPYAVTVSLLATNPTYFGNIAGTRNIGVAVTSTAFNGPAVGGKYSVTMLDPCHNGTSYSTNPCQSGTWSAQRNGCPSIQFNGGPTVTFEGSLQANSACRYDTTLNFTGAVGTSGSGNASITLSNTSSGQATIRMVGTYNPGGFSNISPSGQIYTGQPAVPDPLAGLPTPSVTGWLQCPSNNSACPSNGGNGTSVNGCFILSPGVYNGGITIGSQGEVYLKPGLYVMNGGGITFNGSGKLYTITSSSAYPAGSCSGLLPETVLTVGGLTTTLWEQTLCPQATVAVAGGPPTGDACGAMIYNVCSANNPTTANCGSNGGNAAFGPVTVSGGNALRLRPFCASSDANATAACSSTVFAPTAQQNSNAPALIRRYRNLVFWQSSTPDPTSSYNQPDLTLAGSGNLFLQGTVYAPNAFVKLTGNCGGSGGSTTDLTLQFISYDLQIAGSCSYIFHYRQNSFATPSGYGLVH